LRTKDCHRCSFFLYSKSEPVIEDSTDLVFAPWAAKYPRCREHFELAGFDPKRNFWNAIFDFSGKTEKSNWRISGFEEVVELKVELPDEPPPDDAAEPENPCPELTYAVLCAPPLASAGSSGDGLNIPQTRPANPPPPPAGYMVLRLQRLRDEAETTRFIGASSLGLNQPAPAQPAAAPAPAPSAAPAAAAANAPAVPAAAPPSAFASAVPAAAAAEDVASDSGDDVSPGSGASDAQGVADVSGGMGGGDDDDESSDGGLPDLGHSPVSNRPSSASHDEEGDDAAAAALLPGTLGAVAEESAPISGHADMPAMLGESSSDEDDAVPPRPATASQDLTMLPPAKPKASMPGGVGESSDVDQDEIERAVSGTAGSARPGSKGTGRGTPSMLGAMLGEWAQDAGMREAPSGTVGGALRDWTGSASRVSPVGSSASGTSGVGAAGVGIGGAGTGSRVGLGGSGGIGGAGIGGREARPSIPGGSGSVGKSAGEKLLTPGRSPSAVRGLSASQGSCDGSEMESPSPTTRVALGLDDSVARASGSSPAPLPGLGPPAALATASRPSALAVAAPAASGSMGDGDDAASEGSSNAFDDDDDVSLP